MNTRYTAFVTPTIDPVVLRELATSGMAESTVVDDIGARKLQNETTHVIMTLRRGENRS
jgi:hypothetical protein